LSEKWLGDVGIRVKNLEESLKFYTQVLGLVEIDRGGDEESTYVLLKDTWSGQRLELNWYAESSPFAVPYVTGEALDHFEVRVKDLGRTLEQLGKLGIKPATKKLWVNSRAVRKLRKNPRARKVMQEDVWVTKKGHNIAYIQDPNGIFLCLYDHPEEPWGGPVPDHY
jgi:catechol 2,3-dioxygenase-like lactoylglutathione lyase family enzyme